MLASQLIDLDLRKEEDMAEAERYRALHVDELEETAYKGVPC